MKIMPISKPVFTNVKNTLKESRDLINNYGFPQVTKEIKSTLTDMKKTTKNVGYDFFKEIHKIIKSRINMILN